jgi:hypothetical protein
LGIPADKATKKARMRAHAAFDGLWKGGPYNRAQAYSWLQRAMEMTPDEAHIGRFTEEQCDLLVERVNREFEYMADMAPEEEMIRWDRASPADP